MGNQPRKITYSLAINEALQQMMELDKSVMLLGQGVRSPWYVGETTKGLLNHFGPLRVMDTPVSENAVTGAGVGAAIVGMRSVIVHPRMDFMLYAMDPIINEAANWFYMSGGKSPVPVVFWGIVNRGGEQAAQHSQAFHSLFSHIPGLKVVLPASPFDAKGLMVSAIKDDNPVVYIDERWLYQMEGYVPEELYQVPIGEGALLREGHHVTVTAVSYMVPQAMKAAESAAEMGISLEVIDLRSIKPLDKKMILKSVRKTGRLVVADIGWKTCGISAEIAAMVSEELFGELAAPPRRVCLPDVPAPASSVLEKSYYPMAEDILKAALFQLEFKVNASK